MFNILIHLENVKQDIWRLNFIHVKTAIIKYDDAGGKEPTDNVGSIK